VKPVTRACEARAVNTLVDDPSLRSLLDRLHASSDAQVPVIDAYYKAGAERPTGFETDDSVGRGFWRDKFVALERDKAEFVYALCRAVQAQRIVEAGTSFGVSTLYLAAAVRDNGGGLVTTCEIEESKADVARGHFAQAGLLDFIDLRVGDVRHTLRGIDEPIDLLLLDIWAPIAGDVIALVDPHIRPAGLVVADNTAARRDLYAGLIDYLEDSEHGFTTQTLPFNGGLELAVKTLRAGPAQHPSRSRRTIRPLRR
jgi:predicted O-methyltransferase YrrM